MSSFKFRPLACLAVLAFSIPASAQVCNLRVVTDASPDYSDMASLVHSITAKWDADAQKMWAMFYWNHIGRRQTTPMCLHNFEVTDPIRQFNDYGFTMCSTISGVNAATWDYMGYQSRYWEIGRHTVSEVKYGDKWHIYDNSLSAIYTLCDGKTIAGVQDVGAEGSCEKSGGKKELGHIAKYHCLTATSDNGFLIGADCARTVESEALSFHPTVLKHQYFYKCADYGHRYILNIRDGESYTRHYAKLGDYPQYFVPRDGRDLEKSNPRYRIRANGTRTFEPVLTKEGLPRTIYSSTGIEPLDGGGLQPVEAGKAGEVVFKVEGANVITSLKIVAGFAMGSSDDQAVISISTTNGKQWRMVHPTSGAADAEAAGSIIDALKRRVNPKNVTDLQWRPLGNGRFEIQLPRGAAQATTSPATQPGANDIALSLLEEVNGRYDVLVKVTLMGKARPSDAQLKSIRFDTITQLNSKTQPKLNIGKNTVYVDAGAAANSIVLWPDLDQGQFEHLVQEQNNIAAVKRHPLDLRYASLYLEDAAVPKGWIVFRMDAPTDVTAVTYGGRFCTRADGSFIELQHSFDGGKTWKLSHTLKDNSPPWDTVHYETVKDVPAGVRSVLFRYFLRSLEGTPAMCGIYSLRMEVNHKPADATFRPVAVTFNWSEVQEDYSLKDVSHTQIVDKLPATYDVNVKGADHPVMKSLRIAAAGSEDTPKPGYSDGGAGREKMDKHVGRWVTYGKNLALGKNYTSTLPSLKNWDAGDDGKKLTDGVVGPTYNGGISYKYGALWSKENKQNDVTVDLGKAEKCGAFRIQVSGYPGQDAIKGEVKDKAEVLVSSDGKDFTSCGQFNMDLRWKDLPVNHMWTDEETFAAHNHDLVLDKPVEARYIRFRLTPSRMMSVSEVQVLDFIKHEKFDLGLALPNEAKKKEAGSKEQ